MNTELIALLITAGSLGFIHTILGPDHYLPFIVLSKSRKWSMIKTTWITFLCGLGHVASSVILGIIGIFFGVALSKLEFFESSRGDIAGWLLLSFGIIYTIWGVKKYMQRKKHSHSHAHKDGVEHVHEHSHEKGHAHIHTAKDGKLTPWVLFIIFVFGPCEVLIPLIMYPAAEIGGFGIVLVTLVFGTATLLTMLGTVLIGAYGLKMVRFKSLELGTEALAGFAIVLCGSAILLGL